MTRLRAIALAGVLAAMPSAAHAEEKPTWLTIMMPTLCTGTEHLLSRIEKLGEEPVAAAVGSNGKSLLTVHAQPGGAEWSIVVTGPGSDMACIIMSGKDWMRSEFPPPGEGS